ncbi:hypothetical protein KPL71_004135 [Citrus sinensis]|uniref:Uncharacterized protein n=1 Tax=Citrus sinensis TaxID=2711 RepID=A0ACB8N4E8_CITSI|nr:hypothetical protein KPL71_004135 [Citrus sinensis]
MFHGTHGHTTTECRDFKTQVEDLMGNRYLDEFVNETIPMVGSSCEGDQSNRNMSHEQPMVRVIVGGPTLAEDSNRSRKNYARYSMTSKEVFFNTPATKRARIRQVPIIWMDEDEEGILYPHEDALVIKATAASKKFNWILVDTGSSVDVLFKSTLEEIGIADLREFLLDDFRLLLSEDEQATRKAMQITSLDTRVEVKDGRQEPVEELRTVNLEQGDSRKTIQIGSRLKEELKQELVHCLWAHADVFAWTHEDMPGIDPEVACHRVMSFGLKNVGATYQRLVNKIFKSLIGRTMEVYVDDMITKSKKPNERVKHLEETFGLLRKYKMKLNSEKCAFRVESRKFLGFIVSHRGIEANPEKIQAIVQMRSPRNLKEIQSLTGKLAALTSTLVVHAREADVLFLYMAISDHATTSIIVREEEGVQYPIYYTSKALLDAETRYPPLEKLALALVVATRKLRPYFQAFPVSVITNQPLRQTLRKLDAYGRLVKWAIELSEFDINYKLRAAIKAQAIADFVAEFIEPEVGFDQLSAATVNDEDRAWRLSVDGSSGEQGARAGIVLEGPEGDEISYAIRLEFTATNNQAEYETLIAGLELANAVKADRVKVRTDSQLVANHVSERFQPRDGKMEQYLKKVKQMIGKFESVDVIQIPREENYRADILARMAAVSDPKMPKSVPLEVKSWPSIEQNLEISYELGRSEVKRRVNCNRLKPWKGLDIEILEPGVLGGVDVGGDCRTTMRIYLQALDYEIWEIICDGPFMPLTRNEVGEDIPKPSREWNELEKRKATLNSKAMNALFCALDKKEFHRVSSCESANEIWHKLEVVYEGTNQVKESKISRYTRQYELFQMEQNESVYSMYTRFTNIVNTLGALGKTFSNSDKVKKIIRSLPKEWRQKKTVIEEAKDLNILPIDDLIGSLISYEEDLEAERGNEEKKKNIALKASKHESDEESEQDEEEMDMLARRFRKLFKKSGERRKFRDLKNRKEKKELIKCYECKKLGHIRTECHLLNKLKKKAMVAT